MSPQAAQIHVFLKSCRLRLVGLEAAAGGLVAASLVLAAVLLSTGAKALALESVWVFRGLLLALTIGLVLSMMRYGVFPWLRWRKESALAREMEKRMESSRLELVSAVQLDAELPAIQKLGSVSTELVEAHIARVAGQIAARDPKRLILRGRLSRPAAGFGILLVPAVMCAILLPGLFGQALAGLLGPGRADQRPRSTDLSSWVGDIRLVYDYPAYSGRGQRVVDGSDGTIQALPGTQVAITSQADRNLERAALVLNERALPLGVKDGKYLSGEMVVMQAGSYRFELTDQAGEVWTERQPHPIHIEADRAPRVSLRKPDRDLVVREQDKVDLLYDARDDFGLEQIRLSWRVSSRAAEVRHKVLSKFTTGSRQVNLRGYRWDLATLGLEPGDVVQFTVEALDNDTVLGPKAGRSATRSLRVFSAEEHHQELLERVQGQWERLLGLLADVLELEPAAGGQDAVAPKPKPYRGVYKKTASFLGEMTDLMQALSRDQLAGRELSEALANINRGLSVLQRELHQLLEMRRSRRRTFGQTFARAITGHRARRIQRLERDVLYLEDLLDLMRLEDLDRIARDLSESRKRLAELMRQYKQAPSDEIRRRIENEIARLKEKIAKLLKRQRQVLKNLRDEYLNPEALGKMLSDRDMMAALDRIQKLMMEGKVDEAMRELEALQKQLQDLQAAIDRSRANYGQGKYNELAQELAKIQGELNMITETQRQLTERTGALRDKVVKELNKLNRDKLKKLFERLRKRLERATRSISEIDHKHLDRFLEQSRTKSLERADLLNKALQAIDLDSSLQAADKLETALSQFERSLQAVAMAENRYNRAKGAQLKAYHHKGRAAHREAQAIYQELLKLMPRPEKLLGQGDLKRLGKLSKLQAELQGRLAKLRSQMQKINKAVPLFGGGAMGKMDRSSDHMGQSSAKLGQKHPRAAHPHQQAALSELEALKQALEQSCKKGSGMPLPMGSSGVGMGRGTDHGGSGRGFNQQDVEIPGPEDYQPPEAFRKALLEGMKDPVPKDFEQQVRRYYEELVK